MDTFNSAEIKQKASVMDTFCSFLERLRKKTRHRAIVVVRIVNPVRVELDLAVVEVEAGSVREIAVSVRIIASVRLCHRTAKFTALKHISS